MSAVAITKKASSHKIYHVGIYLRVSQEDKRQDLKSNSDSISIENQKEMLSQFISHMPNWLETRCYIDDGVSGGNFNRKGFMDMMDDVRAGIINLVLVKDLSRFGRNYLESGKYLEEVLPSLNCRFVAIADNIDTEDGENDILPFLNAINDFYLKDVSKRIRSVMKAKAKEGHKLTGSPPYGYIRNPNERQKLIIDADTGDVVRRVFELRYKGLSYTAITAELNNRKIKPPRAKLWSLRTIKLMLQNEAYIGNTVSLKRGTRSYRDGRTYKRDESEWIRVDDTHIPLISLDVWEKVQSINKAAKEIYGTSGAVTHSLFSGLLVCSDCGGAMRYAYGSNMRKDGVLAEYKSYACSTYYRSGRSVCSTHQISEGALKQLISSQIKSFADKIQLNENRMTQQLRARLIKGYKRQVLLSQKNKKELGQQLYVLEIQIDKLFEEKAEGLISESTFKKQAESMELQRQEIEAQLNELVQVSTTTTLKIADIDSWIDAIKTHSKSPEVDRELLLALIEKIEVGARVKKDNQLTQDVRIFYKFVGLMSK